MLSSFIKQATFLCHLSIYLTIYLSIYLYIYLSIYLSRLVTSVYPDDLYICFQSWYRSNGLHHNGRDTTPACQGDRDEVNTKQSPFFPFFSPFFFIFCRFFPVNFLFLFFIFFYFFHLIFLLSLFLNTLLTDCWNVVFSFRSFNCLVTVRSPELWIY